MGKWQDMVIVHLITKEIDLKGRKRLSRKRIKKGKFERGENDLIDEAINLLESYIGDGIITFYDMASYTTKEAMTIMRKKSIEGCKFFLIDTFKADYDLPMNAPVWQAIDRAALNLYRTAKKLDVNVQLSVQVAGASARTKFLSFDNLSGAKSMAVTAGLLILMRPVLESEKDKIEILCPAGLPVTLDPDKNYLIFFFGKNREGVKSPQMVYEVDFDYVDINFVGYTIISDDN